MQNKVLNDLYKQGGVTLFAFAGDVEIPTEPLQNVALALNAGAHFMVVDFSGKNALRGNAPLTPQDLLERLLDKENLQKITQENSNWTITGTRCFPQDDNSFRNLYHNLQELKKIVPQIVAIIPRDLTKKEATYIPLLGRLLIIDGIDEDGAALLEDFPALRQISLLWLIPNLPSKKRFPRAFKSIKSSESLRKEIRGIDYKVSPKDLAKKIECLHKVSILKKNPLDGTSKFFRTLFPLILLTVVALPFFFVTKVDVGVSNMRDRIHERNDLSIAPSFEYTFDGKESMQRIARYGIGRFRALITNERMIKQYVDTTLEENGFPKNSWEFNKQNIPPHGTVIRFSRPDYLGGAATDSIGAAWKYWTSIVSDSIAYITEFYNATSNNSRQHNGIDLASRKGARILAPFAAKAWTSRDERGGVIIGLVREKDVILFMHCDQLLYLDGQEVMAGDPIATVGLTGHTTGPHAHIVTGIISKNGNKRIGNVKYKVIDPIQWFYQFKPSK